MLIIVWSTETDPESDRVSEGVIIRETDGADVTGVRSVNSQAADNQSFPRRTGGACFSPGSHKLTGGT